MAAAVTSVRQGGQETAQEVPAWTPRPAGRSTRRRAAAAGEQAELRAAALGYGSPQPLGAPSGGLRTRPGHPRAPEQNPHDPGSTAAPLLLVQRSEPALRSEKTQDQGRGRNHKPGTTFGKTGERFPGASQPNFKNHRRHKLKNSAPGTRRLKEAPVQR